MSTWLLEGRPRLVSLRRHLSIRTPKKPPAPPSLEGQVAWVAGGVGIVGAGICRGLLRAGATVLVNSRHETRLEQLADELGHPERLICVTGSMLPEHAATTIQSGLERTNGQLNHVVAHCAVRWWARDHGDESSTMLRNADSLLAISPEDFPVLASQLASLHFAAAHHMMPRLLQGGSSYTWVTGGGPSQMRSAPGVRSSLGHVNAAVVYGLAGALRSELEGSQLRVSELRVRAHNTETLLHNSSTSQPIHMRGSEQPPPATRPDSQGRAALSLRALP